ncbi:hypothetical protein [Massilia horti]|uniref:Uncharacterized protein n=1 Tax=Massilia horti TaxID=2562153 RepID=A0A4Y9T7Z6_9BURK|nr:hypothetical protein [Massilia horti]TFW34636.1 hypothetical protein E4O92_03490 [Massilia horti]
MQDRLQQAMGYMIREYQEVWGRLSKAERSVYVIEYQQLRSWLSHATGQRDPVIPSPWTDDEVFDSMAGYWYGGDYMKSTKGMLSVVDSKLITAVRMAERSSRRSTKSSAPAKRS